MRTLLIVGSIASVITFICFMIPELNAYLKLKILSVGDYLEKNDYRGFGISDGLTYSYGIIQGIIFVYGIFNLDKNKWFILFIPLILLSIMINARVGMAVSIIGILLWCIDFNLKKIGTVIIGCIIGIYIYSNYILSNIELKTLDFISEFFYELFDLILNTNNAKYSTYQALNDMLIWPKGLTDWVMGSGESIFLSYGQNSDIGYILQLNYGGILYLLILMFLVWNTLKIGYGRMSNFFLIFIVLSILVCNSKGDFIPNSGGFRLITLLLMYYYQSNISMRYLKHNNLSSK